MADTISNRLYHHLDDLSNVFNNLTDSYIYNAPIDTSSTNTSCILSLRRKMLLGIQLLIPLLADSFIFTFLLKLTSTTITFVDILKLHRSSSSVSSSSSLSSAHDTNAIILQVSNIVSIIMTIIGYILIHHASMEKMFDRGDSATNNHELDELHDMLARLLDDPDYHTEDVVLLSSILTGIRYL